MTSEELLRQRYKVAAPYFYSPYEVGDIIELPENAGSVHLTTTTCRDEFGETIQQENRYPAKTLDEYPHLFQPLPWYVERRADEMPEYVKRGDMVYKIADWQKEDPRLRFTLTELLPATKEEYDNYINRKH